ncbi:hsp70 nucleotide exchange factor FES1 isoform X2 [Phalaenopsis equestris]|uniref:hsp70 nucleotide exchange factor FES1 isoform X2 n=1 Tax=Phalaenopsis equestris TaxID=78828 RepID=UPI0009E4BC5A|nr:hsp70 nucleotide exchange factor FES1 isoform X2 [Phalaenopsis equestris]
MGKSLLTLALCLLLSAYVSASASDVEHRANKSSPAGILWATAKDKSDLLAAIEPEDDYAVEGDASGEFAGGFSSLEGMLQWAIGHSDPEKLKDKASDAQRLSPAELNKRQLELKELMEKLKIPSDAELMKIAINDLNNSSISLEDRKRALNELLILVEPIDNANDLDKLGGLVAVVRELDNSDPEIRTISAWILGKACQNNALVQNQILALGVLTRLMKMVKSSSREEAIKALFAISTLIRNNKDGQELFFSVNGTLMLQDIMSNVSIDIRLQKKAVLLVADLADYQQEISGAAKHAVVSDQLLLKAVVNLLSSNDLDLQEKALQAVKSLLQLPSTDALDLKNFCDLDNVLERIQEQLWEMKDHDYYAEEMKNLISEIQIIFHRKSEKVSWVPT